MKNINEILAERIMLLDGAMGTMIKHYNLSEKDYRRGRFSELTGTLNENNDLLCITQPDIIWDIHCKYLEAGADIIKTNSFNANRISQGCFGLEESVFEMNKEAAAIANSAAELFTALNPSKPRFVAGSIGPINKSITMSSDLNNPENKCVIYEKMVDAYYEQVEGLIAGGVDILLLETIFDTLNAKAALFAIQEIQKNNNIPVMVSFTLSDKNGRLFSGQTPEAFLISVSHVNLLSIGINCSSNLRMLRPYLEVLSEKAKFNICLYPSVDSKNGFDEYDGSPAMMAEIMREFMKDGLINIVGGCCGSTPAHIRELALLVQNIAPREIPENDRKMKLCGLEPLSVDNGNCIFIGEKTNVTKSIKFAHLIRKEKYEEALCIAQQQINAGAKIIDVNMDDAMLDSEVSMTRFLSFTSSDPEIAKFPVMIDSSRWQVIEAGLKSMQGKAMANYISLEEGECLFLERAKKIKQYGALAVVLAIDEDGQATTFDRKIRIITRSYFLLTKSAGFLPQDIIFDPIILPVATGLDEHSNYAVEYLETVRWIKNNLPYVKVIGHISNLSLSFRGNNVVREAMSAVFLHHAIPAGLDMGVVNVETLPVYDEMDFDLREMIEDVILNRRNDAAEMLLDYASKFGNYGQNKNILQNWRNLPPDKRLSYSLVNGNDEFIESDINEIKKHFPDPLSIIEGPLMDGMNKVSELFDLGEIFLPQIIKSLGVLKKAVAYLKPFLKYQDTKVSSHEKKKILLATLGRDIHDIGKNIVAVILSCNNYKIIDMGIMVSCDKIIKTAIAEKVDVVGLSCLINSSLDEILHLAKEMERHQLKIPLIIGGSATSEEYISLKIQNVYQGQVVYADNASKCLSIINSLLFENDNLSNLPKPSEECERSKSSRQCDPLKKYISLKAARKNRYINPRRHPGVIKPALLGNVYFSDISIYEISKYIDWNFFFYSWRMTGKYPGILDDPFKGKQAKELYNDAQILLQRIVYDKMLTANGAVGIYPAFSDGEDVCIQLSEDCQVLHFLRNQEKQTDGNKNYCLADFIAPVNSGLLDYIGVFAITAGIGAERWIKYFRENNDDYNAILLQLVVDRLAEAFSEMLHEKVRKEIWGYNKKEKSTIHDLFKNHYPGIRVAPGHPACPDHSAKETIFNLLKLRENCGISLTENYMMIPSASVCGFYFTNPNSRFFDVGKISEDQVEAYALRKGIGRENVEKRLNQNLNYK